MADLKRATRNAQESRQRALEILDAALAFFPKHAEGRVTVETIADEVGIGKGSSYKHVENKNEIYLLLMIHYEEELAELFRSIKHSDDKSKLATEYFSFRISDPKRYQLFDRLEHKIIQD